MERPERGVNGKDAEQLQTRRHGESEPDWPETETVESVERGER